MKKLLLHNWTLKLASLVLAAILWFLVVTINDPMDTDTYYNIPVKLTNTELLDKENKVYEVLDGTDKVNVTVRAPGSVLQDLRNGDIVAEADMSKLTDINTIAINCYSLRNMTSIESIEANRDVVRLNVEDKRTKWVKISYNLIGEVADGYMASNAVLDQTQIEVSGPKSLIDQISYAGVEMDVSDASTSQSANLDIVLYDKEHNPVDQTNLKKNVSYVRMTVDVLATKEIPVEVNYMGVPAEGYMATGVALSDPQTVKIAGSSYALSTINKITIPEDRLNITGQSSDMTDVINLREYLPDNIKLADSGFNGKVTVTVSIEPIATKELDVPKTNIVVTNVPEGLSAQLPEDITYYTVNVSGLNEWIEPLHQNTLRGTVDVAAWMEEQEITELAPGTYTIPVAFDLAEEIIRDAVSVRVTFS